jgi:ABC-type branched-subunit amino acid transport system substrate-binding protein
MDAIFGSLSSHTTAVGPIHTILQALRHLAAGINQLLKVGSLGGGNGWRQVAGFLIISMVLAACAPSRPLPSQGAGQVAPQPAPVIVPTPEPIPAPGPARVQIGLLLPLSGENAEIGQALLQAAQLALFDTTDDSIALVVRDVGSTPGSAAAAANDVVREGVDLILGPLLANSVRAVAPVAQNAGINLVSFSTDRNVAGQGVFVMGVLPSLQIERIVGYAGRQGLRRFAALLPQSPYGQVVTGSLQAAATRANAAVVSVQFYDPAAFDVTTALAQVGQIVASGGVIDALLIPEGGDRLRAILPLLGSYNIDPAQVRLLGSALWDNQSLFAEPALAGGWFAAPDPQGWQAFAGHFRSVYGSEPPRLASIAYDATLLAAILAGNPTGPDFSATALTEPSGFSGIDGIFRFKSNGTVERGLAIMEIGYGRADPREPAPLSFDELIY